MPGIPASQINALNNLYAFRELSEADLARIAAVSEIVDLPQDQMLTIAEGEMAPLYMVIAGQVMLEEVHGVNKVEKDPLRYKTGLFFGADFMLYNRVRRLNVTAISPAQLLRITAPDLKTLLVSVPGLRKGLLFAIQMQHWLRNKAFQWIEDDELVYLISRKHTVFLMVQLVTPMLVLLGSFVFFGLSAAMDVPSFRMASLWIGILIFVLGLGLAVWRYIDWGNDYYVVTDLRVVWVEKVLFMYESRREAFLSSIRNRQVTTANWLERGFGYGDIIMTVYAGQLTFKNIPEPHYAAHLIDVLMQRSGKRLRRQDVQQTHNLIWKKVNEVETLMREGLEPIPPPVTAVPIRNKPSLSLAQELRRFFQFDTRYELGEMITYRTHHFFLEAKLFAPIVTELIVLGLTGWGLWAGLNGQSTFPTLPTLILLALVASMVILAWAAYHFVDWRNDIYQILPDKLIDKDHKPFQEEHIIQAMLKDVVSLEIERPNALGMLLNFGTVIINSGTDQRLTFDNVPDPARALQDIYNRLYKLQRVQQEKDMLKQVEMSAVTLTALRMHQESQRANPSNPEQASNG